MVVIQCIDVYKKFYYYQHQPRSLREMFITLLHPRRKLKSADEWFALRDFNLTVRRGEMIGFVGHNGSGKSTLLKLIAGIYPPTSGTVEVHGSVAPILELGVGFHWDLTGRENVYLYASILGLRRHEVDRLYPRMVEFAEMEEFMSVPIKYYSSGMYARLGFAVAVFIDPDILVLDEVLAVGDVGFRQRCEEKMREFRDRGKTILLVSHDLAVVERDCARTFWLERGRVMAAGKTSEVMKGYKASMGLVQNVPSV